MTSSNSADPSASAAYPYSEYGGPPKTYQYDLKLEVGISQGVEIISVNAIFADFLQLMTDAAGHPLSVSDTLNHPVTMDQPPDGADFKTFCCVEVVEGKARKILLGFKLQTPIPMSTLKHRMFDYLQKNKLFLCVHHSGFSHGIHSVYLGYLIEEAPTATATNLWGKESRSKCNSPGIIPTPFLLPYEPILLTTFTHGLYVSTPVAYAEAVKNILDGIIVHTKTMPALIPSALRRENASLYYAMLIRQAKFMHFHQNIQITDIDPACFDCDLRPILESNPQVHRVYLDTDNRRAHVSTTETSSFSVQDWIDAKLANLPVDYHPTRATPAGRNKGSNKTTATKYSQLFSEVATQASDNSIFDPSTIKTTCSHTWTRRPPMRIEYDVTATASPPLPKKSSTVDTPITQAVTVESDNLQNDELGKH
jgi:hypothetical protein